MSAIPDSCLIVSQSRPCFHPTTLLLGLDQMQPLNQITTSPTSKKDLLIEGITTRDLTPSQYEESSNEAGGKTSSGGSRVGQERVSVSNNIIDLQF
jgi:hypothetical protein